MEGAVAWFFLKRLRLGPRSLGMRGVWLTVGCGVLLLADLPLCRHAWDSGLLVPEDSKRPPAEIVFLAQSAQVGLYTCYGFLGKNGKL